MLILHGFFIFLPVDFLHRGMVNAARPRKKCSNAAKIFAGNDAILPQTKFNRMINLLVLSG